MKLHYSLEVAEARADGRPIVALESTIISHGMPYPHNLEVAREVEAAVRRRGAVPATIAILRGLICIGLEASQLEDFAQATGVMKCSRRDLAYAVTKELNGATTVAATMILAQMAGIKVFATGGIGGVHRGAEQTLDISADLPEFTQSDVAVVSAGAKAILDLPKTMEYLETLGVPVVGFRTDVFPAFYYRNSGISLPMSFSNAEELARFIHTRNQMGTKGGVLVANPIPESDALDSRVIEDAIEDAIDMAEKQRISGKELTPFLLKHLNQITKGESQRANKALVLNNAEVAAEVASALVRLNLP